MKPSPYNLFGEVPITENDLLLWCEVVAPRITARNLNYYIKYWNVAGKIRASKIDGLFDTLAERQAENKRRSDPTLAPQHRCRYATKASAPMAHRAMVWARVTCTPRCGGQSKKP